MESADPVRQGDSTIQPRPLLCCESFHRPPRSWTTHNKGVTRNLIHICQIGSGELGFEREEGEMVKPQLLPPPGQPLGQGVMELLEQLERYCLGPDLSMKSTYNDLLLAREEMAKERLRYLEVMSLYSEAVAVVEEYQQALSLANAGGMRDLQGLFAQLGLRCPPQVYEALEVRLAVAESSQRLRLPLISKDGDIPDEDTEKWTHVSRCSFDSISTMISLSSSTGTSNSGHPSSGVSGMNASSVYAASGANGSGSSDTTDNGMGGVMNCFLGVTPGWLKKTHLSTAPLVEDAAGYQMALIPEIEARMEAKYDKIVATFNAGEIDEGSPLRIKTARLPVRIKNAVEKNEREEAAWLEDLYAADRQFVEYHNVLEQIFSVVHKLVKDFKLGNQHQYDGMRKEWLIKRCQTMSTKLSVLEHLLLRDTYTQESVPALFKIQGYLVEAVEEASAAYNRAVTRLREYQGVDRHFDDIAQRYHEIVKKLESLKWTIRQVEMDLNQSQESS